MGSVNGSVTITVRLIFLCVLVMADFANDESAKWKDTMSVGFSRSITFFRKATVCERIIIAVNETKGLCCETS